MDGEVEDPDLYLPQNFSALSLRALNVSSRAKLAQFLDLDGELCVCGDLDIVNNYSGIAELVGFSFLEIRNLARMKSPTKELLEQWTQKELLDPTVGHLWQSLSVMERFDVLKDCRRCIERDCKAFLEYQELERANFNPIQDPEVSDSREMDVDEVKCVCVQDVTTGEATYFDAFVCYNPEGEDIKFVKEMILQLEGRYGLELFVPGRDCLPGSSQYVINAYLIEQRCKRMILVMSHAFSRSDMCDFNVRFAQALSPGARSKRLIPVIRERNVQIPRILKMLATCDFTKHEMHDWVWDRLASAIKAPIVYKNADTINISAMKSIDMTTSTEVYQTALNSSSRSSSSGNQAANESNAGRSHGRGSASVSQSEMITNKNQTCQALYTRGSNTVSFSPSGTSSSSPPSASSQHSQATKESSIFRRASSTSESLPTDDQAVSSSGHTVKASSLPSDFERTQNFTGDQAWHSNSGWQTMTVEPGQHGPGGATEDEETDEHFIYV